MRYAGGGIGHYRGHTFGYPPANANETPPGPGRFCHERHRPPRSIFATTNLDDCWIAAEMAGHEEVEHIRDDNIERPLLRLGG
jgi:hypothetical protein